MKKFRLALRSLLHFRSYTIINIVGLALSLACVIVIFRYVYGEFTVDCFHQKLDRTFIVAVEYELRPGKLNTTKRMMISFPGMEKPKELTEDPSVELLLKFEIEDKDEVKVDDQRFSVRTITVDSTFFSILDFPVIRGISGMGKPEEVFITEEFGKKLFGNEDPLGKTIEHASGRIVTVAGIIGVPENRSVISFEMLLFYDYSKTNAGHQPSSAILVLLHPNQDYREVNRKYEEYAGISSVLSSRQQLVPFGDFYFSDIGSPELAKGNMKTIVVLIVVGLMLFVIGIVNFINIYTAVVLRRGREFGMKKVFGATGWNVFSQLFLENLLMIGIALVIAFLLTELFSPAIRNILGFSQRVSMEFDLLSFVVLLIVIPLLTTVFPYLRYNYTAPIVSLRSVGKTGGRSAVRRILLVFQYTVTLIMITASLFFVRQILQMIHADPGYRTEDVIQATFHNPSLRYRFYSNDHKKREEEEKQFNDRIARIEKAMNESPLFIQWTFGYNPSNITAGNSRYRLVEEEDFHEVMWLPVSSKWLNMFELQLVAGRLWDEEGKDEYYDLVVSESVLSAFGIRDFTQVEFRSDAPNSIMIMNNEVKESYRDFRVIGVVEDIHVGHLSTEQPPIFFSNPSSFHGKGLDPVLASIMPGKRQEAIEFLRQLHADTFGGDFEYSFVKEDIKEIYKEDWKVAAIYSIFTLIAILVSALGLYSMSLYDVQQRYKEIAIRKVNGATTSIIIRLLLRRYMVLLGISFVIAAPIAWLAIERYLQSFAYRASIPWWVFLAALAITAGVSLLTLIWHTRKAAETNPATVIRSE